MVNYVLEILDGDRAGEVLPVAERMLRIGRKPGNDIVLTDEKTSGVHCEIAPEGDRLVLKDLGSTNGTFLDGKRVSEIVLTPGDVVTIGRTRVKFRAEGESAVAGSESDEFKVRQLDAARLQRRGGSLGLVAVLLVVAVGAGGWFWWQSQQQNEGQQAGASKQKAPLVVSGNRLANGNCESDEGFELRAAGIGFGAAASAHTGTGAFAARRGNAEDAGSGDNAGKAEAVSNDSDFAVMRIGMPVTVFAGRALTIAAHCQTFGGARMTVRAQLFAENEQSPFRFVHGAAMATYDDGWQRVEFPIAVPSGCDRLLVEVVALLPTDDAEAMVDDLLVVEGSTATVAAVALKKDDIGQTVFGFGAALAVRSTDGENPATLLAIVPDSVPAAMQGLHRAGLCVLSDLGATLQCSESDHGFSFAATGVDSLQFVLPSEAAAGLLVAGEEGRFASAAAASEFSANSVLFGSHTTRAMLRFASSTPVRGTLGGGLYRLAASAATAELVVGFRAERQVAAQRVRQAEAARRDRKPGLALDELNELFATVPMDSEQLQRAQTLRGELLLEQAERLRQLQKELEEAGFFSTRGGFERVASGVQAVIELYGERNVEDLPATRQLLAAANARLTEIDEQSRQVERDRLTALADAFGAAQENGLQQIVKTYIDKHLPTGREEK